MTAQRGRRWLGAGLLAPLILASCRTPYAPLTPHTASADGVTASVIRVGEESLGKPVTIVEVKFAGGELPPLGDAWLAPRGSPPCETGVKAVGVHPDAWFAWPNVREIAFPGDVVEQSGLMRAVPTVIDVDILPSSLAGARRCLRLPVAEAQPQPEWIAPSRWFLGMNVQTVHPVGGAYADIGNGLLIDFYGGVVVGPARLRLEWLFGQSRTTRPPPAGFDEVNAVFLGGALALEMFPIRLGSFGLGLNAGYQWLLTDFNASVGSNEWNEYRYGGPRGPRVMLRLARVPPPPRWPGFSNRKDGWAMSVDLIAARWSGLGPPPATTIGIGIGMDTGYWW